MVEIFSVSEDKAKGYVVALLSIVLRALCYVRLHLGSLKLALEWVSWGRGRVNYLGLTVIFFFFFNLFVSKVYIFFARYELQLMS